MMKTIIVCIFLVSAASAMMMFRNPFQTSGSRCFDETGIFYKGRIFQNGHYVYKYVYVYPPGHYPTFHINGGYHPMIGDSVNGDQKAESEAQRLSDVNLDDVAGR